MAISGGIKFFKRNQGLYKDGGLIGATSNDATAKLMIDTSRYTAWESSGSDDTTTETITWDLPASATIDRLFVIDHNLKQFTAQYWNGAAWTDFASVVGIDGALGGGITETAFTDPTAYYEFTPVTTSRIQITATKTQTADQEKSIATLAVTEELGTFEGFAATVPSFERDETGGRAISGRLDSSKRGAIFRCAIAFKNTPDQADLTLIDTLFEYDASFMVWLCGGRRGSTYFLVTPKGWALDDVYHVALEGGVAPAFAGGIYVAPVDLSLALVESIP